MTTPRRLQLDRRHLIQMAAAPDFYAAVPSFHYLRDIAMLSWQQAQESKGCQRCGGEWKAMRGVCDAIFMRLRQMQRENDPALEDVRTWLSSRKGYPVGKVVLYYRRSRTQGRIAKFEF